MLSVKAIPSWRRLAIAGVSCALAGLLFHGQIAIALITRGDDFLTRGDISSARYYYFRAMRFDHNLGPAVDRFVFFSIEQRTPKRLREAIIVASAFLSDHPHDAALLADRALCYQLIKRYNLAAADFAAAASASRSAKYYTFAGWATYRLGERERARHFWKTALSIDGQYSPAVGALRKTVR